MTRLFIMVAMLFIATQTFSATGYGYNNNRIAVSADGNNQADPNTWGGTVTATAPSADAGKTFTYNSNWQRGDEDDWSATPAALAMLANAGLEGKLVHYSYNNFIGSPAHTSAVNVMKDGVNGALQRFKNFNASVFYDVSANNTAAINHLAEQIKISTASDPLYFVSMGPTEFLYQALAKVKADGKEASINHLYIVSHSNYNDNNIRRANHRRIEHVLQDFPVKEGTNFLRIKDQNQSSNLTQGWSTNNINGSNDYSQWTWMRDHADANVNFLWDRMNVNSHSKADISDAGMIWFLLYGDQNGNPSKLKTQFVNGIVEGEAPDSDYCPAIESFEKDGLMVFEAERIPLKGAWKLGTDDQYASGGKYIYYDGPNSYNTQNAVNTLTYSFKINNPGTYTFKWFVRQNEEERGKVDGQQGTDLSNDAWVRFLGDVAHVGGTQTSEFFKFYGRSDPGFWLHGVAEFDHNHNWVNVKFPSAGTYTMEICGRSHGYQIDKIVMAQSSAAALGNYTEKTEAQSQKYWSETGTPDPNCGSGTTPTNSVAFANSPTSIITGESFDVTVAYSSASQNDVMAIVNGPDGTWLANAIQTVQAGSGNVTLTVNQPTAWEVGANYNLKIAIRPVGGAWDTNLDEKDVKFEVKSALENAISLVNCPAPITTGNSLPVAINYSSATQNDVLAIVSDPSGVWLANAIQTVPAGTGTLNLTVNPETEWPAGTAYQLKVAIRPVGGAWDSNIKEDNCTFDVLPSRLVVSIQNQGSLSYISASNEEKLNVVPSVGANEQFEMIENNDGTVSFKGSNDLYVSSENGNKEMTCTRTAIGAWEKFTLVDFGNDVYGIKANNDMYLRNSMLCTSETASLWQQFKIQSATSSARKVSTAAPLSTEINAKFYPNPSDGLVHIDWGNASEAGSVEVFNLQGQLIYQSSTSSMVDLSQERAGIYIIRLVVDGVSTTGKLVIR
ncbi:T9SS type A sorting domain-containing protein [Flammeovirga aprica]|uniref:T9SS type A sorting domain-containing protein n=1 Tax=Flammeovirga aprica JL-4 TaxID=694437 RepID=A0A7X9RWX1_9BACT|nr:T9SS type A sorting domain-containing protein [Flammeovirga aprica]NME70208.1 T9SS type A sorting domain-containing protein [Flammeovirga aprica JL-4]